MIRKRSLKLKKKFENDQDTAKKIMYARFLTKVNEKLLKNKPGYYAKYVLVKTKPLEIIAKSERQEIKRIYAEHAFKEGMLEEKYISLFV